MAVEFEEVIVAGSLKTGPYSFGTVRWFYSEGGYAYVCMHHGSPAGTGQCLKGQKCPSQKLGQFNLGSDLQFGSCEGWCAGHHQPWALKCTWKGCKSCCQCADDTSSVTPEAQTVCDSAQNGCLSSPLSGSVNEALRLSAMLPCGFYGYGDYVLTEDINSWHHGDD